MSICRTDLLCFLLFFGVAKLQGQIVRQQQAQEPVFHRGITTKHNQSQLRFISQPVTTKPTQFFQQQQQPRFRQQNVGLAPEQLRTVNNHNGFRTISQTNLVRDQPLQQNAFTSQTQQEIPINQQQNFLDQNSNNFNVQEQSAIQQNFPEQFNNQFQGAVAPEQNVQQTFERLNSQSQQGKEFQRSRQNSQPQLLRRPANRPQVTTTFVSTQSNRRPQESPESIIRSLTNVEEPIRGTQEAAVNRNTGFTQPDQTEFNVPLQKTNVKQRQRPKQTFEDEEAVREQAQNAKYSFSSEVKDGINDNNHIRAETRDGLKLSGVYSYSDGYFKRTVHYEADENGYRIVKEENEPIGNGPNTDLSGTADVAASVGGANIQYSIRAEEVPSQFFTEHKSRSER